MALILVIGSSNTDMVLRVAEIPRPGQTISGGEFQTFGGGKGANQAIAARRAGGNVSFIAAIGDDDLGRGAIGSFAAEGIDVSGIEVLSGTPSGVAFIFVSDAGENCIGVAPGANACLSSDTLLNQAHSFDNADLLLIQLETPLETVRTAIEMAAKRQLRVVLNPAPAAALPDDILEGLFCITPNESEAEALTGIAVNDVASATVAADRLLQCGVENVVVTLGSQGALLKNSSETFMQAAESVTVIDTTGAGDTFNGVFTTMVAKGHALPQAIEIAVRAASLSVQTAGAIASIPTLDDQ